MGVIVGWRAFHDARDNADYVVDCGGDGVDQIIIVDFGSDIFNVKGAVVLVTVVVVLGDVIFYKGTKGVFFRFLGTLAS